MRKRAGNLKCYSGKLIRGDEVDVTRPAKNYIYYVSTCASLITVLVYLPALSNGFVNWDDEWYVVDNPMIRSPDLALLKWAFGEFFLANWHPLTQLSHALDYAFWSLNPVGHHLTNVLFHGLNTFLVTLLVFRLIVAARTSAGSPIGYSLFFTRRGMLIIAAVAGLLFGIHPIHVESVGWVSERKDVLSAFFFLLSLLAYLRYAKSVQSNEVPDDLPFYRKKSYLAALGFFILALMSKPMAVSLPIVLLILDWYPLRRKEAAPRTLFLEKIPFFSLSLASAVITLFAQHSGRAFAPLTRIPFSTRLLVGFNALIAYLGKMLFPSELLPFYPYPKDVSVLSFEYALPVLLATGITAACIGVAKKQRIWPALWGYYVVTLLPVLGIVQVGNQAMADRYAYLPSLAPFLLIGLSGAFFFEKISAHERTGKIIKTCLLLAATLILAALWYRTASQLRVWKNGLTLWNHVIETVSSKDGKNFLNFDVAFNNRGNALEKSGRFEEALKDFTKSISLNTDSPMTHYNLGHVYRAQGHIEEAINEFQTALTLKPDFAEPHYGLGIAYQAQGRVAEAVVELQKALKIKPDYSEARYGLGDIYSRQGRFAEAQTEFQSAVTLKPDYAEAHYSLGNVYAERGRTVEAINAYRTAVKLNPKWAEAHINLGCVYYDQKHYDEAIREYQTALRLKPDSAEAHYNLGIAYSAMGRKAEATRELNAAFRLKPELAGSQTRRED